MPLAAARSSAKHLLRRPADRILDGWRRWHQHLGRVLHPDMHPRVWSNAQLRLFAPYLNGDIVNVSGWRDGDKQGSTYRSYFPSCRRYAITNSPNGARGASDGAVGSIPLDLEGPLPEALRQAFDVAFCHTVLEHVFDNARAMAALQQMSRDVIIVVVPFLQDEHREAGSYGDFWRYTPDSLRRMLESDGRTVVYLSCNDNVWWPIYVFAMACRHVDRWRSVVPEREAPDEPIGRRLFNPRLASPSAQSAKR
jgi:hypothetical protein